MRGRRRLLRGRAGRLPSPERIRTAVYRIAAPWGLTGDERERLVALVSAFLREIRIEPARGFEVDDHVRLVVATRACRLLVGLDLDTFPHVSSVIVHPSTVVLHGPRPAGGGLVTSGPLPLLGQAHYRGPVVLSWSAVRASTRFPGRGDDVVLHEFAHQLDMLDGVIDGTPPLGDAAAHERWVAICTRVYDELRAGRGSPALRPYAGTNPGEFFAVATEVFFCRPHDLAVHEPALYSELAAFYGQDPASRTPAPALVRDVTA